MFDRVANGLRSSRRGLNVSHRGAELSPSTPKWNDPFVWDVMKDLEHGGTGNTIFLPGTLSLTNESLGMFNSLEIPQSRKWSEYDEPFSPSLSVSLSPAALSLALRMEFAPC